MPDNIEPFKTKFGEFAYYYGPPVLILAIVAFSCILKHGWCNCFDLTDLYPTHGWR